MARNLSWPLPTAKLSEYVDQDDEFQKDADTSVWRHHESCPEQLPMKVSASGNDLSTPTDLGSTEAHLPVNSFGSTTTDYDAMHPPGYACTLGMFLLAWHWPIPGLVPLHTRGSFPKVGPGVEGGGDPLQETADNDQFQSIMLKNLPNDYTRDMLIELLDNEGFASRYNFVYLPMDFHRKAGLGYAFVNMETPEDAQAAWKHFTGFQQWTLQSEKVCEVAWSTPLQGLQAHIDKYRNSPVMHEEVAAEFKPVLFSKGQRIPFPGPTKNLKKPRMKYRMPAEGKLGGQRRLK